jgi:hypothetical protein
MSSKRDVGPDGQSSKRDIEPDGLARQSAIEEDDVEGHSMLMSPTLGRDLAKERNAEIERSVKNKNHANEAKRIFRK